MADDRTPTQRSETMRRIHSRNTSCELALRSELHRRGLRYSLRKKLPGSPDVIFVAARVAVFVDGCFWHGCPDHCRRPSTNTAYWNRKINRNMARDESVNQELHALGWRVVRLWGHAVHASPARCGARIEGIVRRRMSRL
jgi:DNA mismatch endonuclease, patch repair protein